MSTHLSTYVPYFTIHFPKETYFDLMFYKLPDTEDEQTEPYERDLGSAQIHGQLFEYKFCALVFLRAKNEG